MSSTYERELSNGYVALRWALRNLLGRAGVPTNPGWGDDEIVGAIAAKLGVEADYWHGYDEACRWREQRDRRPPNPETE